MFCDEPTCADDVLLITDEPDELQLMLDIAFDYSGMENYLLKSVKHAIVVAEPGKTAASKRQRLARLIWSGTWVVCISLR